MEEARAFYQPSYLKNIVINGSELPINIVTTIILVVGAAILLHTFTRKTTAIASHILIDDHSDKTKQTMEEMKKDINNDPKIFAEYAKKYSTCPSGKTNGGNLGTFALGDMVPAFDKVVFSPKSKVGVIYGPVHTHFGYHLILIHKKNEQRQLVLDSDALK